MNDDRLEKEFQKVHSTVKKEAIETRDYVNRITSHAPNFLGVTLAALLGAWLASGLRCTRDRTIEQKVDELHTRTTAYELKTQNVLGNETPETFYEIDGRKAYLTIDGKNVEEYVNSNR